MPGALDRFDLGLVPCSPLPGGWVAEAAEHVEVLAESIEVAVHVPADPLQRADAHLAQVAGDHGSLGGTPGQRVERGNAAPGPQHGCHPAQMISTGPGRHQHRREHVPGRVVAPLARKRFTVSFLVRGRACFRTLIRVEQAAESPGEITHAASQVGERI